MGEAIFIFSMQTSHKTFKTPQKMKKTISLSLLGLMALALNAQPHRGLSHAGHTLYEPRTETQKAILTPRFTDNWSITHNGGIVSPQTYSISGRCL